MSASTTLNELKLHEPYLRAKGVCALYLFGSVVRGESGPDSDVDLSFDIAPDAKFSLFDQAQIICDLAEALGTKVDFVPHRALHPLVKAKAESERITVFQ